MNKTAKTASMCLLLCLILAVGVMLSACDNGKIVSKPSLNMVSSTNSYMSPFSSYSAGRPLSLTIEPDERDAQVFCYVSADPSKGCKEEVQPCDEKMPNAYYVKNFTFNANVDGAHCVTKQVSENGNVTAISWLPFVGSANGWKEIDEDRYLEAIVKVDGHIVGYTLTCYRYIAKETWRLVLLAEEEFPQVRGQYQNITEKYLRQLAASIVYGTTASGQDSIVRKVSELAFCLINPDSVSYPKIGSNPVELEVLNGGSGTQVLGYVSADPSKSAKEEIQICDETMPDAYNIKKFKFNSKVTGANCAAKQISEDGSRTTIRWMPFVGSANGWVELKEDRYLEIVVKENGNIVTYVLFACDYLLGEWTIQPLLMHDFPQVGGQYQNVTEEYLRQLAKSVM